MITPHSRRRFFFLSFLIGLVPLTSAREAVAGGGGGLPKGRSIQHRYRAQQIELLGHNTFNGSNRKAVDRGAAPYFSSLGRRFVRRVLAATSRHHVCDMGAGNCVFATELAGLGGRVIPEWPFEEAIKQLNDREASQIPHVSAVTYKMDHDYVHEGKKFQLLEGRLFEDIPPAKLKAKLGQTKLFFEKWGVLAYTHDPTKVLRKLCAAAPVDFEYFVEAGPRHWNVERQTMSGDPKPPRSSLHSSTVKLRDGRVLTFPDWLRTVKGLKVTELKVENGGALLIRRDPRVPLDIPKLRLINPPDESGMPPHREFLER